MIVMMPAVPAFAGDLKGDDALGTRAIMEFQYESINRGGHSIYEMIARAGVNPMEYIRFYNLRSYDRINVSGAMRAAEEQSGVSYQQASEQRDAAYEGSRDQYQAYRPPPTAQYGVYEMEAGYGNAPAPNPSYGQAPGYGGGYGNNKPAHEQYQQGAAKIGGRQGLGSGRWDSVSECYMLGGEDIRNVPWEGGAMNEIDAFVSEELYIHSKASLLQATTQNDSLTGTSFSSPTTKSQSAAAPTSTTGANWATTTQKSQSSSATQTPFPPQWMGDPGEPPASPPLSAAKSSASISVS